MTSARRGSACQAGSSGGAAGQLDLPAGVAVAGGEVYVADPDNHRVSVFTTDGGVRARVRQGRQRHGGGDVCAARERLPGRQRTAARRASWTSQAVSRSTAARSTSPTAATIGSACSRPPGCSCARSREGVEPATVRDVCTTGSGCLAGSSGRRGRPAEHARRASRSPAARSTSPTEQQSRQRVHDRRGLRPRVRQGRRAGRRRRVRRGRAAARPAAPAATARDSCSTPLGVAVAGGEVYVAEFNNKRVSVFTTDGAFVRAFGKNVNSTDGSDICTAGSGCKAGSAPAAGPGSWTPTRRRGRWRRGLRRRRRPTIASACSTTDGGVRARLRQERQRRRQQRHLHRGKRLPARQLRRRGRATGHAGRCRRRGRRGLRHRLDQQPRQRVHRRPVCSSARSARTSTPGDGTDVCTDELQGRQLRRRGRAVRSFRRASRSSGGEVFVADAFNHRVSVFTPAGAFVRAFGGVKRRQ